MFIQKNHSYSFYLFTLQYVGYVDVMQQMAAKQSMWRLCTHVSGRDRGSDTDFSSYLLKIKK